MRYIFGVSLSQIETFIAIAEAGHMGRAATKLKVAQPAVSRKIRLLEEELGTALFHRTTRGMQLSRAGEIFLRRSRAIVGDLEAAVLEVRGERAQ